MNLLVDAVSKRKWWFVGGFLTGLGLYMGYHSYFAAQRASAAMARQAASLRMPTISGV